MRYGQPAMGTVLLVSKPLAPPWNDGSKNLARDVAEGMRRHLPRVLSHAGATWRPRRGVVEVIHDASEGFAPSTRGQLRVLGRLATGPRDDLWHFFFAPNPRTSAAARALCRARRVPSVHTVCSRPRDLARARRVLFGDRTVVLSRATEAALRDAGADVTRIAPCAPDLDAPTDQARREARARFRLPEDAPLIVYPGDLEHGEGAGRILDAHARLSADALLVMACRAKTDAAREAGRALRARHPSDRIGWIGETPHIHALLGAADVVALPSSDLFAKVDLPIVLIEAMMLARAVLVVDDAPAAELAEADAARAVAPRVDAIAAALDGLLGDDAERRALGARARAAARARYSRDAMAAAYETLYDELLGVSR